MTSSASPLEKLAREVPPEGRILDAGGWFKPSAFATHVIDLLPWETRGARLQLSVQPEERFTRESWFQANFLAPEFRMPYPDGYFDLSICTHTLEDLPDPLPLIGELQRVARAGYIEVPSRASEQTVGIRDRRTTRCGHPHHHWIIDRVGDNGLRFCNKADSFAGPPATVVIPLTVFERQVARGILHWNTHLVWKGGFDVEVVRGQDAYTLAVACCSELRILALERWSDRLWRTCRRLRQTWRNRRTNVRTDEEWWREILALECALQHD
jgi:hypothetical protein